MRVTFVSPSAYPTLDRPDIPFAGGAEFQQIELARALRDRGHDVSFVVGDYGQADVVEINGLRVFRAFALFTGNRKLRFIPDMLKLRGAILRSEPDVVNQRSTSFYTGQCCHFAHEARAAFTFSVGIDYNCYRDLQDRAPKPIQWLYRWGIENAELVLAQTHEQAALMQDHFRCSPRVMPNMIPMAPTPDFTSHGDYVLWVGSLAKRKCPERFVELARRTPDIPFVMVGGPGEDAGYDREIESAARSVPNLEVRGFVAPAAMGPVYEGARLYVNTSRLEGLPNTYLHSWNRGVPTLSMSVDPDGVIATHGLGVVDDDVESLAGAIERLWNDDSERRAMGQRARHHVEQVHDVQSIVPRVESWLSEVTDVRR